MNTNLVEMERSLSLSSIESSSRNEEGRGGQRKYRVFKEIHTIHTLIKPNKHWLHTW
jgi:hypothetical protein